MSYFGNLSRASQIGAVQDHHYQSGMSQQQQRNLSATLSPAVRSNLLANAIAALPSCWSQQLDDCARLAPGSSSPAGAGPCQTIADGWIGDYDKMQAAFEALPDCPVKRSIPKYVTYPALVLLGVGIGIMVGP